MVARRHIIGYEHGFINQAYDILKVIGGKSPVVPMPDFEDALRPSRCSRPRSNPPAPTNPSPSPS